MPLLLLLAALAACAGAVLGPHALLAAPADLVIHATGNGAQHLTTTVLAGMGFSDSPVPALGGAVAAVMAPGLLCLVVAESTRAGAGVRRSAAALLVLSAVCAVGAVPSASAAFLLLLAILTAALLAWPTPWLTMAPVVTAAAFLGTRVVVHALDQATSPAAAPFQGALALGCWWGPVLAALACAPVIAAVVRLLRR